MNKKRYFCVQQIIVYFLYFGLHYPILMVFVRNVAFSGMCDDALLSDRNSATVGIDI